MEAKVRTHIYHYKGNTMWAKVGTHIFQYKVGIQWGGLR